MTSLQPGTATSADVEVAQVSPHGVWVWVRGLEFFLPCDSFPWFLGATIRQIHNVRLLHDRHLHWPELDVDLELDSLQHPDRCPLVCRP
ncbi:MAG: DUF2442 domain-containing protein [Deltaproteobacteria bacterium]|nr:DUF2442 domain-containing protein [Deltaproteobacteria bacterium]